MAPIEVIVLSDSDDDGDHAAPSDADPRSTQPILAAAAAAASPLLGAVALVENLFDGMRRTLEDTEPGSVSKRQVKPSIPPRQVVAAAAAGAAGTAVTDPRMASSGKEGAGSMHVAGTAPHAPHAASSRGPPYSSAHQGTSNTAPGASNQAPVNKNQAPRGGGGGHPLNSWVSEDLDSSLKADDAAAEGAKARGSGGGGGGGGERQRPKGRMGPPLPPTVEQQVALKGLPQGPVSLKPLEERPPLPHPSSSSHLRHMPQTCSNEAAAASYSRASGLHLDDPSYSRAASLGLKEDDPSLDASSSIMADNNNHKTPGPPLRSVYPLFIIGEKRIRSRADAELAEKAEARVSKHQKDGVQGGGGGGGGRGGGGGGGGRGGGRGGVVKAERQQQPRPSKPLKEWEKEVVVSARFPSPLAWEWACDPGTPMPSAPPPPPHQITERTPNQYQAGSGAGGAAATGGGGAAGEGVSRGGGGGATDGSMTVFGLRLKPDLASWFLALRDTFLLWLDTLGLVDCPYSFRPEGVHLLQLSRPNEGPVQGPLDATTTTAAAEATAAAASTKSGKGKAAGKKLNAKSLLRTKSSGEGDDSEAPASSSAASLLRPPFVVMLEELIVARVAFELGSEDPTWREICMNLPQTLPCHPMVEAFYIDAEDPREGLRGQRGVRVIQSEQKQKQQQRQQQGVKDSRHQQKGVGDREAWVQSCAEKGAARSDLIGVYSGDFFYHKDLTGFSRRAKKWYGRALVRSLNVDPGDAAAPAPAAAPAAASSSAPAPAAAAAAAAAPTPGGVEEDSDLEDDQMICAMWDLEVNGYVADLKDLSAKKINAEIIDGAMRRFPTGLLSSFSFQQDPRRSSFACSAFPPIDHRLVQGRPDRVRGNLTCLVNDCHGPLEVSEQDPSHVVFTEAQEQCMCNVNEVSLFGIPAAAVGAAAAATATAAAAGRGGGRAGSEEVGGGGLSDLRLRGGLPMPVMHIERPCLPGAGRELFYPYGSSYWDCLTESKDALDVWYRKFPGGFKEYLEKKRR